MRSFVNVFAHIRMVQAAVQQVQDVALRNEIQAYLGELVAMIDEVQIDQSKADTEGVGQKLEMAAKLVCWLDHVLDILM